MRKLTEQDTEKLMEYIGKEPEMNLFFIGDIECYGIDSQEVSVYALEDGGDWDCVLLKYHDFYIVYSCKEKYRAETVAEFLKDRIVDCMSGKTELVEQLHPFYPQLTITETYMCRCGSENLTHLQKKEQKEQVTSRRLTPEDSEQMMELYLRIEEFAPTYREPEKAKAQMETDLQYNLAVGVFEGEKLAAIAKNSASNSQSAMIVGVATDPVMRQRGYASFAVQELCERSFAEGKKFLCLFYDNPAAGRIYHRIGFQKVGSYAMMR